MPTKPRTHLKLIITVLCLLFVSSASAHLTLKDIPKTGLCVGTINGSHFVIQSWDLNDGISFERYAEEETDNRSSDRFTMITPDGSVALVSQHLPNLPNMLAVARQPDAIPDHARGFLMLATQEHRMTHLMSFDVLTGQKYRHRLIDGKVTSIIPLANSMLLLVINNPEATIHGNAGNYLELVDTNIHSVHQRIMLNTPTNGTSQIIVEMWDGVQMISEMSGNRRVGRWGVSQSPNGRYKLN
jgi:hypothetical protein